MSHELRLDSPRSSLFEEQRGADLLSSGLHQFDSLHGASRHQQTPEFMTFGGSGFMPSRRKLMIEEEDIFGSKSPRQEVDRSHPPEIRAVTALHIDVPKFSQGMSHSESISLGASLAKSMTKAESTINDDTSMFAEMGKAIHDPSQSCWWKSALKVVALLITLPISIIAFPIYGAVVSHKENANRALLRNPTFTLPEHLQSAQGAANRAVEAMQMQAHISNRTGTSFDHILKAQTANHAENERSAQGTVIADSESNAKADLIQEALRPQLQTWKEALEATGKSLGDDEYRALVAVATQNVADKLVGSTAKNFMVTESAALYGRSATARIASTIAGKMSDRSLSVHDEEHGFTGVRAIHDDIAARATLIGNITGRDSEDVSEEIYAALRANPQFTNKMQRMEKSAVDAINNARDLPALKEAFIKDRIATLRSLALFSTDTAQTKGTGEEYLKLLLQSEQVGGQQGFALAGQLMGVGDVQQRMIAMREDKEKITGEFQRMFNFLGNLENDFAAYVAEHEANAQAQLEKLAAVRSLNDGEQVYAHTVEQELLAHSEEAPAKIYEEIDSEAAVADPIPDAKLREIFDILIGSGKSPELGAPTMTRAFLETLHQRGKLAFADEEPETRDALLGLTHAQIKPLCPKDIAGLTLKLEQGDIPMRQFGPSINDVRIARGLIQARQVADEQAEEEVLHDHLEEHAPLFQPQRLERHQRSGSFDARSQLRPEFLESLPPRHQVQVDKDVL